MPSSCSCNEVATARSVPKLTCRVYGIFRSFGTLISTSALPIIPNRSSRTFESTNLHHGRCHDSINPPGSSSIVCSIPSNPTSSELTQTRQLLDPLSHNHSHGTLSPLIPPIFLNPQDSHWYPPPLRHDPPRYNSQETPPPSHSRTALSPARHQHPHQRRSTLPHCLHLPPRLSHPRLQSRCFPPGSREQGKAGREPDDGSGGNGGHDGDDEGEYDDDGAADGDYGLD